MTSTILLRWSLACPSSWRTAPYQMSAAYDSLHLKLSSKPRSLLHSQSAPTVTLLLVYLYLSACWWSTYVWPKHVVENTKQTYRVYVLCLCRHYLLVTQAAVFMTTDLYSHNDSDQTTRVSSLHKLATIVLRDCAFLVPRLIMAHIEFVTATEISVVTLCRFHSAYVSLISVCYLRAWLRAPLCDLYVYIRLLSRLH
jgi:hypothetical protein